MNEGGILSSFDYHFFSPWLKHGCTCTTFFYATSKVHQVWGLLIFSCKSQRVASKVSESSRPPPLFIIASSVTLLIFSRRLIKPWKGSQRRRHHLHHLYLPGARLLDCLLFSIINGESSFIKLSRRTDGRMDDLQQQDQVPSSCLL